jgi:hypothetical protein
VMLSEISSRQLSEWMEFAELEPFGWRAYMNGPALIASVFANAFFRRKTPWVPADFMPVDPTVEGAGVEPEQPAMTKNIFQALKMILNPRRVKKK